MQSSSAADARLFETLTELVSQRATVVLTGAGISTESGIPDYRGPETRRRARNPVQYTQFLRDPAARRRYWARSLLGWPRIAQAVPSAPHHALTRLERAGYVSAVLTQNVDSLHVHAGTRSLVELHGALREVVCLDCGSVTPRSALQVALLEQNPGFIDHVAELAPDGDAELDDDKLASFRVVDCARCGGALKPHVVFFGETVPRERVTRALSHVAEAELLLVVGSSLAVFSGLRFVLAAKDRSIPIAILNLGPCRGDPHANLRIEGRAGEVLTSLADALCRS